MEIEMTVKALMPDPFTNMPIIVLSDQDGRRKLPIWIGKFEADAIELQIQNVQTPRPMTYDLLKTIIDDLQGRVERVVVSDLCDNTFYATIHIRSNGRLVAVDARPSDAINLALRTRAKIFVEESVIESARSEELSKESMGVAQLQKWLEGLTEDELGKYKM